MDALWNVEEKLKISTPKAIILLVFTSILVILACLTIILVLLKNKATQRNRIVSHNEDDEDQENDSMIRVCATRTTTTAPPRSLSKCGLMDVRNALLGTVCWSGAHKWNDDNDNGGVGVLMDERNCLQCGCVGRVVGRRSKLLPVWQRPILMGEKCELPRFSGLILYDERGRPLPNHHHCHHYHNNNHHQYSTTY